MHRRLTKPNLQVFCAPTYRTWFGRCGHPQSANSLPDWSPKTEFGRPIDCNVEGGPTVIDALFATKCRKRRPPHLQVSVLYESLERDVRLAGSQCQHGGLPWLPNGPRMMGRGHFTCTPKEDFFLPDPSCSLGDLERKKCTCL